MDFPCSIRPEIHPYSERLLALVDVPDVIRTEPLHFAIGVFQGCVLSSLLFNLFMQQLLDVSEKPDRSFRYRFSSLPGMSLLFSAYADDLQVVTSLPENNQAMLNDADIFLHWAEIMAGRPNNFNVGRLRWKKLDARTACKTLPAGYHPFGSLLTISVQTLWYLDDDDFKSWPTNQCSHPRARLSRYPLHPLG